MKKNATKLLEGGRISKLTFMLLLMGGLFSSQLCFSQNDTGDRLISGKVVDSKGSTLPGVNISVKGTTTGTITNADGTYSLNVPPSSTLVYTFIGFNTIEESVGDRNVINVTLSEDLTELEEVVVTGYGTQRKQDITGSISRVTGDEVMLPSTSTFDQMLQGRVSGVQVSQNDGAPGGNVNVLIRGVSSITGGNSPLYVVDGYPIVSSGPGMSSDLSSFPNNSYDAEGMTNNIPNRINPLSAINPSDIESIEVLKDASATAIYGSRGANGVILITTKRGSLGKSKITVNISHGIQEISKKVDVLNAREYAQFVADGRDNAHVFATGGSPNDPNSVRSGAHYVRPEFRNPESLTVDTDWQDVIFQTAPISNYQISATGGSEAIDYFVSTGYFKQKGILKTSEFERFNLRSNLDIPLSDKIKVGTSISGSHGIGHYPNSNGFYGRGGVISQALAAAPTIPVYDDEGNPYTSQEAVTDGLGWLQNPLTLLEEFNDDRKVTDIFSNNYLEFNIVEGLTFRITAGIQYSTSAIKIWRSSEVPFFTTLNYPATAGATKTQNLNWLNENTINYKKIIGKHNIDILAGFTSQKDSYERLSAGASGFPTNNVTYLSGGIVNAGTHILSEWAIVSLLSRVNYTFNDRYLFTGTIRRDGSSRFGTNSKWGTFPSFSVGYLISEESFMQSLEFISNLKVRFSFGLSGNNQIGNYSHIGLLESANYIRGGNQIPGLVPNTLPNDLLTWEKSKQRNFGFDLGLFNNRVTLTGEIYNDLKTDLLLGVELPSASGFTSSTQNIGDIENKGIEIALQSVNIESEKFEWTTDFTFSRNRNKVLALATEGARLFTSGQQIVEVGYPVSSFWLYNLLGVFETSADLAGVPVQDPRTQAGDYRYEDIDGNGVINGLDKKVIGDPWPDFIWGVNNNFRLGNISLSILLNGQEGAHVYFSGAGSLLNSAGVQNQLQIVDGRWRSEQEQGEGEIARAIRNNYALGFGGSSTKALFDASYVRIKNINLSYNFPSNITSRLSLSGLSMYANVSNLHTWTDYPGYNPESSTSGDNFTNAGLDDFTIPLARTYTLGLNITF